MDEVLEGYQANLILHFKRKIQLSNKNFYQTKNKKIT
jgi:hypothetical protein